MPSFDVVSEVDMHEVDNALNQAQREVAQRYDFRDTGTSMERSEDGVVFVSNSEGRLSAALDVFREKLVRRNVSLKVVDAQDAQPAGGATWKQLVKLRQGVSKDAAKDIVKTLKGTKLKVQASIQGDAVRVTGKKRDDLQEAIAFLKTQDLELPLQYKNFRD